MKQISRILFLLLLSVAVTHGGDIYAQNWKDIANKAKKTVKDKNKKKDDKTKKEGKTDEKTETEVVNEKSNNLEGLSFDANTIFVEYQGLFENIILDPASGKLEVKKIMIKNLPKANYGNRENLHKLSAVLKLNNQTIHEFVYDGISEYSISEWTEGSCSSNFNITKAGKYSLEFQIDEKLADKIDFDIIQSVNKNDKTGWFVNAPMQDLGKITAKRIEYGKPVENSELVFKFYEAILDIEGGFVDATPISVRLMKENKSGNDTYLGGYLDKELSHNKKWKLTDNIFLTKPGEDYKYVMYSEILSSEGKYYIDLFYDNDVYRYNFEVKAGQFISTLSNRSKDGVCWMEREYIGIPKYENFRATANISGKTDNVRMSLKTGSSTQGYAANKPLSFTDGQKISVNINFDQAIKDKYMYCLTEYILTLKKGDEIIAQDIRHSIFDGYSDFPNLIYNPEETVMIAKSAFSVVFMEALAKLPAGNHKLKFVYEIASGNDSEFVGLRTVTYKAKTGNPTFTKWAEETQAQIEMSNAELGNLSFLRSPSNDWVYYENNCGRTVWLRQDDYKEYYLYPGDQGKFDRNNGYMEQWNFGTWEWNSVNDFVDYKTIYMLTGNEIAMLYVKQVAPDAVDKLKEIQDVEFKTQEAFIAKVKSLIGEEVFKKHEDLIVQSASIDFIKICQ